MNLRSVRSKLSASRTPIIQRAMTGHKETQVHSPKLKSISLVHEYSLGPVMRCGLVKIVNGLDLLEQFYGLETDLC